MASLLETVRPGLHRAVIAQTIRSLATFDNLKTFVLVYVVVKYVRRAARHLLARGFRGTTAELWKIMSKVCAILPLMC